MAKLTESLRRNGVMWLGTWVPSLLMIRFHSLLTGRLELVPVAGLAFWAFLDAILAPEFWEAAGGGGSVWICSGSPPVAGGMAALDEGGLRLFCYLGCDGGHFFH